MSMVTVSFAALRHLDAMVMLTMVGLLSCFGDDIAVFYILVFFFA
tara:strand:+ start:6387 stop:6521 length:135 start_codon:yes stop_codon:yes gene_type:complete